MPATALFPIVLLLLIRAGGGLGIGSIVLLLLGTQWYILFNVIAGAMAIPTDLKEACDVFAFGRVERWRKLFLPGIFPFSDHRIRHGLRRGMECEHRRGIFPLPRQNLSTVGLGAVISRATDTGTSRYSGATLVMAAMVVTFNRLVWRRLYALASTRYKLEG